MEIARLFLASVCVAIGIRRIPVVASLSLIDDFIVADELSSGRLRPQNHIG